MPSQSGNKMKDKLRKLKCKFHVKKSSQNACQSDTQRNQGNEEESQQTTAKLVPPTMPPPVAQPMPNPLSGGNCTEPTPQRPQRPNEAACIKFPHAIVKFNFQAQQPDELNANKHDLLVLLKRVDENWYYACTLDQTRIGFIPANFLDVRIDLSEQKEVAPSVTAPRVIQPLMEEGPYIKITDSCSYDVPKPRAKTPPSAWKEEASGNAQISPIPDGALLLVNQEFIGEKSEDLSASVQDVLLWLEPGAKRGDTPPEDWIKCSKLNGVSGDFPGNIVQPLSDEVTILMYLKGIPQAEATRDYEGVPGQCIPLKKGEVLYLSKDDGSFCYGRSASGKEGKVPKDVCRVTVPLQ